MKRLKNKVFLVIFLILTIFLFSILAIFNFQNYKNEVDKIKMNLMRMDDNKGREFGKINPEKILNDKKIGIEPKIFMDSNVYAIMLDSEFNILEIVNHTENDVDEEKIKSVAENIIKNRTKNNLKIGNLYYDKYSHLFTRNNNSLIIIENENGRNQVFQILKTSILIFIILEIVIIIISKELTAWIIKPVIEAFNKQKQFIEDASHELKTPLSVIIASSESLENEPNEIKWLNNIKSEAERMNNLVTDLLDMAKSEHKIKEQYVNENISKLVERTVLTFESLIFEKDINFDYKIEDNIMYYCNGNQIKQVVGILLDNAIKHSYSKGEIKVELKKEKGSIILTVANKGKAIPKEEREKIFERFYRGDESRNRNENRYGLGLAIAKNIVTNHNGNITVGSENEYTVFKIVLK